MDLSALPVDFFVTSSQFTKTTYRDGYPSINPRSSSLSQAGKVIVVTGASQGLGRHAFAVSFAKANASALVLVARKEKELSETAEEIRKINPSINILTRAIDIRSEEDVKSLYRVVKQDFGTVDVLINNAGSGKSALPIREADPQDWWYDFEVNVKGTLLMTQEFLKLVGNSKPATIINITSAAGIMTIPHTSSYSLSKLVQIQIQRFVGLENPNITAMSLHPGAVLSSITKPAFLKFSLDTHELAGGAAVWLATERARFMNGRYMGANWSIDDLMAREKEIVEKSLLFEELQGSFGKGQFDAQEIDREDLM